MKKLLVILLVLATAGGGLGYWYVQHGTDQKSTFRTVAVERGPLEAIISATGTLEPEEVIDVGAQVAGRIEKFGQDPTYPIKLIDYGSKVKSGTVLAQIDDALYKADVEQG